MDIDQVIDLLTPADAEEYSRQTDKYVWVQYTFLDPHDIPRRFTARVENALDGINNEIKRNAMHKKPTMKKQSPLKLKDMYIGQLITRGDHPNPQIYTVAAIRGLNTYLVWFEGSRMSGQWIDYSHCYKPTLQQIEYSIAADGRLASGQDIKDLDLP